MRWITSALLILVPFIIFGYCYSGWKGILVVLGILTGIVCILTGIVLLQL